MQTIELVGDKSVVRFDLQQVPNADFIQHRGCYYVPAEGTDRLLWNAVEGDIPSGSLIAVIGTDGAIRTDAPRPTDAAAAPTQPIVPSADAMESAISQETVTDAPDNTGAV